jgi:hypothetical protein
VVWAIGIFMTAALARGVFEERDDVTWSRLAPAARKVAEVAPPGAAIVAREQIYLLAHRLPPAGLESIYSTKLDLGARENALFHILPSAERDRRIKAAGFAATVVCDDDERADEVDGWDVYSEKAELGTCTVFWKPKPAGELSQ